MSDYILYNGVAAPPQSQILLERPELKNILQCAIEKPLTLVVAGAGYGKSQAVSSALCSAEGQIIWLLLHELDNVLLRLWERVVFAIDEFNSILAIELTKLNFPQSLESFNKFIRLIAKELEEQQIVIVLDDFHYINNPDIIRFVDRLISCQISGLSVVIISRSEPEINFSGIITNNLMTRITEDNLRFSQDEMEEYLLAQNLILKKETLLDLYSYCEGWILAISLIAASIKSKNEYDVNHIHSVKQYIYNIIEKEVFAPCSKELKTLLIKLSFLNFYPGKLVDLLCDSEIVKQELLNLNVFVSYDHYSKCYNINNILKEYLINQQSSLGKDLIEQTNLLMADWFYYTGADVDALFHYQQCNRYDKIFDIILTYVDRVLEDTANLFIKLIDQAPQKYMDQMPIMEAVKAKFILNNNRIAEGYKLLLELENKYKSLEQTPKNQSALGEVYVIKGIACLILKSVKFVECYELADKYLPNGSQIVNDKLSLVGTANSAFLEKNEPGEIEKIIAAFFKAVPFARKAMNGCGYGLDYLVAGEFSFLTCQTKKTEKYLLEAIGQANSHNQKDIEGMAYFLLTRYYVSKGNFLQITAIMQKLKNQKIVLEKNIEFYDIIETYFLTQLNIYDNIDQYYNNYNQKKSQAPVTQNGFDLFVCSYLLHTHRHNELLILTEQLCNLYKTRNIHTGLIYAYNIRALCFYDMGNEEEAISTLQLSYELANPNNIIMPFIERGKKMRTLARAAKKNSNCNIPEAWLENICTKSNTYAKRISTLSADYRTYKGLNSEIVLTQRELNVLSNLCQGLSVKEIAEEINISTNTVKSMLNSIYNKLGANNSLDAVRLATKMNIEL